MRAILVGFLLAVMTVAASAQGATNHKPPRPTQQQKGEDHPPPVDEKDYKASLKTLPEKSYDPWKSVR